MVQIGICVVWHTIRVCGRILLIVNPWLNHSRWLLLKWQPLRPVSKNCKEGLLDLQINPHVSGMRYIVAAGFQVSQHWEISRETHSSRILCYANKLCQQRINDLHYISVNFIYIYIRCSYIMLVHIW